MRNLRVEEMESVAGGFHLHFNVFQAVFTVIGAGIIGGPVGAGIAVAAAIGAQGLGNLHDMAIEEYENGNHTQQ